MKRKAEIKGTGITPLPAPFMIQVELTNNIVERALRELIVQHKIIGGSEQKKEWKQWVSLRPSSRQ